MTAVDTGFQGHWQVAADWRQLCVTDDSWAVQSQDATRQNLKRFEGAFNATQHDAWMYPGFERCKKTVWNCFWAMFCVWTNWDEMHWHYIVLTCFDHGNNFDLKQILTLWKLTEIQHVQTFFVQGQMPHLFWCWILQSCARPLDCGQRHWIECSGGVKTTTCKIVPCGVESRDSTLQSLKSFEGVFIQCRQHCSRKGTATNQTQICAKMKGKTLVPDVWHKENVTPTMPHFATLRIIAIYERVIASLSSTRSVKKQAIAVWMIQILVQSLLLFPADVKVAW